MTGTLSMNRSSTRRCVVTSRGPGRRCASSGRATLSARARSRWPGARAEVVINGHLEHEEHDVEAPLGDSEDDPEFKELAEKLRPASIVDAANALAWMQDGAGERERSALRSHIPGPVVTLLTLLLARRYRREVAPVWV